jgi:hypothetical protein
VALCQNVGDVDAVGARAKIDVEQSDVWVKCADLSLGFNRIVSATRHEIDRL